MKTASVADVKARLGLYLKASADSPVVVTHKGKAVAVLVGVGDDEELERVLHANSRQLRRILDAADKRIDEGHGIEYDEFWRRVEAGKGGQERNGAGRKKKP